jgi:hypothetical protein
MATPTLEDLLKGRSASARRLIQAEYEKDPQQAIQDFGPQAASRPATLEEMLASETKAHGGSLTNSQRQAVVNQWNLQQGFNASTQQASGEQDYNNPNNPGGTFNPKAGPQVIQAGGKTSAPDQPALGTTDEQSVRIANTLATNADAAAQAAVKDAASVPGVTKQMVNSGLAAAGGKTANTAASSGGAGAGAGSGSSTAAGTSTGGGDYKTVKGVLNFQGNPFTGRYQGTYYANGKVETPDQIKQDFIAKYGQQAKFIMSVPELGGPGGLLDQAIKNDWGKDQFTTQFANTQWAQTHPGDIGLAEIKRISAPEQYNTDYNAAQTRIASIAKSLGMSLTPQQLGQQVDIKSTPALDQNAVDSGQDMTNWLMQHPNATDADITKQMANYGTIDPTTGPGGLIRQFSTNLQSLAQQYGVYGQFSPDGTSKNFEQKALEEAAGGANLNDPATMQKYEQMYKTAAINTYKPFADQINAGAKVSDLASPYVNTIQSLLEVSPADVQLGGATGYGAMVSKAMAGDANGTPTNLYDFANQVRSQPEWLKTQNAHTTILGGIDQLINKMGLG